MNNTYKNREELLENYRVHFHEGTRYCDGHVEGVEYCYIPYGDRVVCDGLNVSHVDYPDNQGYMVGYENEAVTVASWHVENN